MIKLTSKVLHKIYIDLYNEFTFDAKLATYMFSDSPIMTLFARVSEILALARTRLEESGESGFDPRVLLVITWVDTVPREQFDSATERVRE